MTARKRPPGNGQTTARRRSAGLVVFLRGVNVGGHRTFRPAALAQRLKHLDAVNIGAAGTFVIRKAITQAELRADLERRLPFQTEIVICPGREILRMVSRNPFAPQPRRHDLVFFVSVLSKRARLTPALPLSLPSKGRWLLRILGRDHGLVYGMYRREMKVLKYLDMLDKVFGVPVTTRNWNTISAIARVLGHEAE